MSNFQNIMAYWGGKDKNLPPPKRALSKKQAAQSKQPDEKPQSAVVIVIPIPNTNTDDDNQKNVIEEVSPDSIKNVEEQVVGNEVSGYNNFNPLLKSGYDNNNNNNNGDNNISNPYNNSSNVDDNSSSKLMDSVKTSYNSSNYGGGSSAYGGSLYGGSSMYGADSDRRQSYLLDDDDDGDYYDDDGEGEGTLEKRSYIETDISEESLQKLESLLILNPISSGNSGQENIDKKYTKYIDLNKNENPTSNPYISGTTVPLFINSSSAYKDSSFLAESTNSLAVKDQQKDSSIVDSLTSWNSEFQKLIEMDDCLEKFERLSSLEHDFVYAAETYGRIIISEHFLSIQQRTIKPVSVGGIAGGEKYIVQGILFKFAVENETFGLYGNDENAMKTAAHELNGCTSFLNVGVKGLHVPLMAYIDYRGFRLVAMSLLPISKKSLIYGSSDAGQTVHTSNTLFNHLFTTSSKIVNLKSHIVQDSTGEFKTLHGPIDIEGHIGSDNRFYLLDFARLSPPEPPTHRGSYLYKLLRLEFVRTYSKPLCSDAFSPMVNIDIENHNNDVKEAYEYLLKTVIPKMADTLDKKLHSSDWQIEYKEFPKVLHSEGINIRLIGYIYQESKSIKTIITILIDAVVRTLKSLARELLRREMKKTHLPSDYPYRQKIINFLNLIFGQYKDETQDFWENILLPKMFKKFKNLDAPKTISDEFFDVLGSTVKSNGYETSSPLEMLKTMVFSNFVLRYRLFNQFIKSIGLTVTNVARDDFKNHALHSGFLFVDPDIVELTTIITRLNIIDYADGMSLYYKSLLLKENSKSKSRLLAISKSRLEQSLSSMSTNYSAIYQLGNVIKLMAKFDDLNKYDLLTLAETTYISLEKLRIEPNLLFQSKICRSKTLYQKIKNCSTTYYDSIILKLESIVQEVAENYSNFKGSQIPTYVLAKTLSYQSNHSSNYYQRVIELFEGLIKTNPSDYKSHISLAMFYLNLGPYLATFITMDQVVVKIGYHLKEALTNDPTLIKKLNGIMKKNCWKVFPYAPEIPTLKSRVYEFMGGFGKNLVIPKNIEVSSGDMIQGFGFESLKMIDSEYPKSITVVLEALKNDKLSKINLSGSDIENSEIPQSLLPLANHLVKLNLGKCAFVNDDNFIPLLNPSLKVIKVYDNSSISDAVIETIAKKCTTLEVLDIGGCSNISSKVLDNLIESCPDIRKLGLPISATTFNVSDALDKLKSLYALDLLKCKDVSREFIVTAFDLSTSIKKLRDSAGVPHFMMKKGTLMSIKANQTFNALERLYYYNYMESSFLLMTLTHRAVPFATKVLTFYYHEKHPLIKFRDSPLDRKNHNFIKAFHVERSEKPTTSIAFCRPFTHGHQHTIRNFQSNMTSVINFSYDFTNYIIHFRIINSMTNCYNASLNDKDGAKLAIISNQKLATISHEIDIHARDILMNQLLIALSCCFND